MRFAMLRPLALEASRMLAGNGDFYNLPRKFKISVTGCRVWCPYPEINDIGLTATTRVHARHARGRVLSASCGRALHRTAPGRALERVCPLASGAARH